MLGDPRHREMVVQLEALGKAIRKPEGCVVVSAHWEEPEVAVTSHASPSLIYDYYGFPDESYLLEYPAPGDPALAETVVGALRTHDIAARLDPHRGFDHGLFIPFMLMFPDADVPCVQLSLKKSLDPETHIRLGEALAVALRDGILLVGSGFSFHNLKAFFAPDADTPDADNAAFEAWLRDACENQDIDEAERSRRLVDWSNAPAARYCHPREEHLLPLHVCYGAAKRASMTIQSLKIMGKQASLVIW